MGKHSVSTARRSSGNLARTVTLVLVVIVVLAIVACLVLPRLGRGGRTGEVLEGQSITVQVESGSSTTAIANLLVDEGVIASADEFVARATELGKDGSLQAGTYELTGGQELDDIIDAIASGQTATLTIPEGYTLKQIAERVGKETELDADEFYKTVSTKAASYASRYTFLKHAYKGTMEGFLFPATYELGNDLSIDGLVCKMLDAYQEQFSKIDMRYAKSKNLDEYDVVTLAAIIEKESRTSEDKAQISSVFYNRLKARIPLGSDVTTYYAVGKDLTEELTKKDLASKSPYNTRNPKKYGLPAGPICSPGAASLEAAANPAKTDDLYFFWSQSEEKTMFFKTQKEFSAAWKKYGE